METNIVLVCNNERLHNPTDYYKNDPVQMMEFVLPIGSIVNYSTFKKEKTTRYKILSYEYNVEEHYNNSFKKELLVHLEEINEVQS